MGHDDRVVCGCVADHRPPVLEYEQHHIWPLYLGGVTEPGNLVWVCGNAHTNIHECLRLMLGAGRALSDTELQRAELRPVSRYAAAVARDGYHRWQNTTTGGPT